MYKIKPDTSDILVKFLDSPWAPKHCKKVHKEQDPWSRNKISIRNLGTFEPSFTVLFRATAVLGIIILSLLSHAQEVK